MSLGGKGLRSRFCKPFCSNRYFTVSMCQSFALVQPVSLKGLWIELHRLLTRVLFSDWSSLRERKSVPEKGFSNYHQRYFIN